MARNHLLRDLNGLERIFFLVRFFSIILLYALGHVSCARVFVHFLHADRTMAANRFFVARWLIQILSCSVPGRDRTLERIIVVAHKRLLHCVLAIMENLANFVLNQLLLH